MPEEFDLAKWAYGVASKATRNFKTLPPDVTREDLMQEAVTTVVRNHDAAVTKGMRPNPEVVLRDAWKAANRYAQRAWKDRAARLKAPGKDPVAPQGPDTVIAKEERELLGQFLDKLPPKERSAIAMKYGLLGNVPSTLDQIAAKVGCNASWVKRGLLDPALEKLATWASQA